MKFTPLAIPEVLLVEPKVFFDMRGSFYESFSVRAFGPAAGAFTFVQDNQSVSRLGVVRGLHYQIDPHAQGKLVRVLVGEIFDVAVDIRRGSPSFGRWVGQTLSAENRRQLWVPPGFAHGFMALSEGATVFYKTTEFYVPAAERAIRWDDPEIGIAWPQGLAPVLASKDAAAPFLAAAEIFA